MSRKHINIARFRAIVRNWKTAKKYGVLSKYYKWLLLYFLELLLATMKIAVLLPFITLFVAPQIIGSIIVKVGDIVEMVVKRTIPNKIWMNNGHFQKSDKIYWEINDTIKKMKEE